MLKVVARFLAVGAVLLLLVGCGYDTSATFGSDGSVTVGLKFLFPKSLMSGSNGMSFTGLSASDIASANTQLQEAVPGRQGRGRHRR